MMIYHGEIVTDTITNMIIGTIILSVWFNPRCAVALLFSLVAAKLTNYYDVAPLHLIALIFCAFISIGKLDGIKPTLIEVESNEVNYIVSAIFMVRVAAWTLYLLGLYGGGEAFYITSMLLILFEVIVILGSLHNGTTLHRFTNLGRNIHDSNVHSIHLAKPAGRTKTNGMG